MQKIGTIAPGPGNYDPSMMDHFRKVEPKIRQSRFEKYGDWITMAMIESPSPDSYQTIESDYGAGKTIPRSPRIPAPKSNGVPGPGAYKVGHQSFLRKSHNSSVPDMDTT
jgi:hypothetical protein